MGQILHGSATTTEAVRRAIQHSQESLRGLARRYGINPKTVAKWKKRDSVSDLPTRTEGPSRPSSRARKRRSSSPSARHTLLPLDDCLYALQPTIPHLTRSSLHRCLQRHGISRLPQVEGGKPTKRKFKTYPIGYFHIELPRCIPRKASSTCSSPSIAPQKFAFVRVHEKADRRSAAAFLQP